MASGSRLARSIGRIETRGVSVVVMDRGAPLASRPILAQKAATGGNGPPLAQTALCSRERDEVTILWIYHHGEIFLHFFRAPRLEINTRAICHAQESRAIVHGRRTPRLMGLPSRNHPRALLPCERRDWQSGQYGDPNMGRGRTRRHGNGRIRADGADEAPCRRVESPSCQGSRLLSCAVAKRSGIPSGLECRPRILSKTILIDRFRLLLNPLATCDGQRIPKPGSVSAESFLNRHGESFGFWVAGKWMGLRRSRVSSPQGLRDICAPPAALIAHQLSRIRETHHRG
jgi:hypothetical protein